MDMTASHNFDRLFFFIKIIERKRNTIIKNEFWQMNIYILFPSKTRRRAACYCIKKMGTVQTPPKQKKSQQNQRKTAEKTETKLEK